MILAFNAQAAEDQTNADAVSFPSGNSAAGQAAFKKFGCIGCHGANLTGLSGKAPALQFDQNTPDEQIVTSIISPSHTIAAGFGKGDPENIQISEMPDLWKQMSVRELVDITAYLKQNRQDQS
ncbi:MAG: c-type cytochrome [Candidatus Omnitrophica bacterium]|nr:c-type cytochrome [Candidatus Omnitrophota bacterium]